MKSPEQRKPIPLDSIHQIVLVGDDAFGPPCKSLLVSLVSGERVDLDKKADLAAFIRELQEESPELAQAIAAEINTPRGHANWEVMIYQAQNKGQADTGPASLS